MRKLIYFFLLGTGIDLHVQLAHAQGTSDFVWAKRAGGTSRDEGLAIATDGSGNSVATGSFNGTISFGSIALTSAGSSDIFIAKYDASGNVVWAKRAGGTSRDEGLGIATDAAGNSIATGYFLGAATFDNITLTASGTSEDIFIAKYDPSGNVVWARRAGGTGRDEGLGIATDGSGNSIVTGYFIGTATFDRVLLTSSRATQDIFIAKYDALGNVAWARQAGGTDTDQGQGLATDGAGNSIVTGFFNRSASFDKITLTSTDSSADVFVAKYDAAGNVVWAKQAGGTSFDEGNGVATDGSNNSIVTGSFNGTATFGNIRLVSAGLTDLFVAKYDASGNVVWAKPAGGTNSDYGFAITTDKPGNSIVTGNFRGRATFGNIILTSSGLDDIFIVKYDGAGNLLEAKQAGSATTDPDNPLESGYGIATDGSGNSIVAGSFYSTASFGSIRLTSAGTKDIFVAKYGDLVPDIAVSPASLSYGNVLVGNSAIDTIVVSSMGNATLNVSATTILGANANDFVIVSGGGAFDLAPGKSQNVVVRFAPATAGNKNATLRFSSNDPNENPLDVALTGRANRPPVVVNPILDQTLTLGGAPFTRNLIASPVVFNDPDGDTLRYTTSSSNSQIATANISGTTLMVSPVAGGSVAITIAANDNRGGIVQTRFTVTVNRSPVVANTIANQTLTVGGAAFTRNLNAAPVVFTDPDQDPLTYTASSNATNIATASISGSTLTVAPVAGGSATITVTANDNKGGTVSTTFTVTVNRPPVVSNAIANQMLTVGGAAFTRNLNAAPAVFTDPDQDALTYTASSSATNIATASISGATLTVAPITAGNATITVTANDGRGGTVSTTFNVNIVIGNRPPVVANAIPNQIVTLGGALFTRDLNATPVVFTDPDQDVLTYTASSSATNIATANISGSTLTVSPVAGGSATITVTANDNKGGTVSTTFTVAVNRPPVVSNAIPNQTMTVGGASFMRNLNTAPVVFTDPDQDPLTYTASSSAMNIATASISGSTLAVISVTTGSATITVTANDNRGGTVSLSFTVTITPTPVVPEPPSDLVVEAVSTRQIDLQWKDNSANENGFRLERRIGAVDTVITVNANVTRYQDTSLRPGAPATYQIRAFNAAGNSAATNAALATTATGLRGDVIPDFRLNAQDVSRVVDIIFQSAANLTRLDSSVADCEAVFPDGKINVIDVVYIVNRSLGSSLATAHEPARCSNTTTTRGELIVRPSPAIVGGTVNLSVTISVAEPVAAVQFKFRYDNRKITLGDPDLAAQNSSLQMATARVSNQLAVLVYNLSERLLSAGEHELLQIPLRLDTDHDASNELQIEGVLVVGEQGRVIPVQVRHQAGVSQTALPERFDMGQNYPNPFSRHAASGNATTEIAYTLPAVARVRLSIYNLVGQEIAVLIDETQTPGNKRATWDVRDRAGAQALSGVYFYRLRAGNFVATKKMLIMP